MDRIASEYEAMLCVPIAFGERTLGDLDLTERDTGELITTFPGVGYRMELPTQSDNAVIRFWESGNSFKRSCADRAGACCMRQCLRVT